MIIGVHGKIGSGKQTFAKELARHLRAQGYVPYYRIWAGKLKEVIQTLTDERMITEYDNDFEDGITDYTQEQKNIRIEEYDMSLGRMLQVIGTDLFRDHFSKRTWINAMLRSYYNMVGKNPKVVWIVPDTRFPNEADELIDSVKGVVVSVARKDNSVRDNTTRDKAHESEVALDNYTRFFEVVDNDGTIGELSMKAYNVVSNIIKK